MDTPRDTRPSKERKSGVTGDLADRIAMARRTQDGPNSAHGAKGSGEMTGLARGMRIGTEFIAAILVGGGLGFVIDSVAGTTPWIMLVFLLLGFAAGILNVTRVVAEMNAASPPPPGSDLGPDADDEDDR